MEMRLSRRTMWGVAAMAMFLVSANFTQASEKLKLTHTVYLGGLYVGKVKTDILQTGNSYQIESKAETDDTWKWLFRWVANGRSAGLIQNSILTPEVHVHKSAWNKKKRGAFIEYSSNGDVEFELFGKANKNLDKYTPLDPESVHHSLDPMSMILSVATRLENGEDCIGTYPIFDGRRRYDVMLTQAPERQITPTEYSVFHGAAKGCKIQIERKGGFRRYNEQDVSQKNDLVLWTGSPIEGGRIVPVHMEVQTMFGAMELHLAKYSQGKAKLAGLNGD